MFLRKKTLIIIIITLLIFLGFMFYVSSTVLLSGFVELEEKSVHAQLARIRSMVELQISQVDDIVFDWSSWDDTYEYIAEPAKNEEYVTSNLVAGTFNSLALNIIIYINLKDDIVFSKAYDLEASKSIPVPPTLVKIIGRKQFTYTKQHNEKKTGILMLDDMPLLFSVRPILNSNNQGPARGTLLFGRFLTSELTQNIAKLSQSNLAFWRTDQALPPDFAEAYQHLATKNHHPHVFFKNADDNVLVGYTLFHDTFGKHSLIVQTKQNRSIYAQGKTSLYYFSTMLFIAILIIGKLLLWALDKLILARLIRLELEVQCIQTGEKLAENAITIEAQDEITDLSKAIKFMLQNLAEAKQFEQRFGRVLDHSFNEIYLFDLNTLQIIQTNRGARKSLGYEIEELQKLTIQDICEEKHLLSVLIPLLKKEINEQILETRHRRKDGSSYPVEIRLQLSPIDDPPVCFVIALDMTKRQQAEQKAVKLLAENRQLIRESLSIQEEERRHLARELHDEFSQHLSAIQAEASIISALTTNMTDQRRISAEEILSLSNRMHDVMRSMVWRLRPPVLDEFGLTDALEEIVKDWQKRHSNIKCHLTISPGILVEDDIVNIYIYRVVQECLTNITKHAQATWIKINLSYEGSDENYLVLQIEDNGIGMDLDKQHHGLGLIGIRERAESLNGSFYLKDASPGIKIIFKVPFDSSH